MKRYLQTLVFFVVATAILPMILSAATGRGNDVSITDESGKMTENVSSPSKPQTSAHEQPPRDTFRVYVVSDDVTLTLSLEELTTRVLYAEMPASFELEALKAQAVAIRSYILYAAAHPQDDERHPQADICTDYSHCVAYRSYEDAVEAYGVVTADDTYCVMVDAVAATKGEYITYNSEPINAVFHAASAGRTESCKNIWGADVPYLQSVETPESDDVYREKKAFLPSELKSLVEPLGVNTSYNPQSWFTETVRNDSGRVDSVTICGTTLSGKTVRSVLGLRSTNFSVEFVGGYFVITTVGYGHGVGLSQEGANTLAQNGADYHTILAHYYPCSSVMSPTALFMSPTA